jgi:hypothetical protein
MTLYETGSDQITLCARAEMSPIRCEPFAVSVIDNTQTTTVATPIPAERGVSLAGVKILTTKVSNLDEWKGVSAIDSPPGREGRACYPVDQAKAAAKRIV